MASLDSIQTKWIELFEDLSSDPKMKHRVASPFLSVSAFNARSILYVGKATRGRWGKTPCGSTREQIRRGREFTTKFLTNDAPRYNSGFWRFARKLSAEASKKWGLPTENAVQHIAWTNILKIGARKGNPHGLLRQRQEDLAVETLRCEIESARPKLIYFVTGDYDYDVIGKLIGDTKHRSWKKRQGMWWRLPADGLPAVLWTYHPQGKSKETLHKWLRMASELLPRGEATDRLDHT